MKVWKVWDRPTRVFHWVNLLAILVLIATGLFILNAKYFEIGSDGKILLKTVHVYAGYVFAANLVVRLIWAFLGNRFAQWKAFIPVGRPYWTSFRNFIKGVRTGHPPAYLGHNPLASLMAFAMFVVLTVQAATGLVLAGTDLYMPPLGHEIAEWVTASGEDHAGLEGLRPGSGDGLVEERYQQMRQWRSPIITTHIYAFYVLIALAVLHILGVVIGEMREGSGLVSAMITGRKTLREVPEDAEQSTADESSKSQQDISEP